MINIELLIAYGAVQRKLLKDEMLFQEDDEAVFYYQIISGSIKMNNYDESGNETIQGLFKNGQSFGEPAILGDFKYPANAEAVEHTVLVKLEKSRFLKLVQENPSISLQLLSTLSKRLRFKAILSKEIKSYDAEHRIMTLLNVLKENVIGKEETLIDITRQTIANLTGLRVETVIRAIKRLEGQKQIKIIKRKIYL